MSISRLTDDTARSLPPYRLVIVDESHNLRNRREPHPCPASADYIERASSRVILLSATPLQQGLRRPGQSAFALFVDEDQDLGLRPERLIGLHRDRRVQAAA